jgi:hypothetical protein
VICGDVPTDYLSAKTIKHPRQALRQFAQNWRQWCEYMKRGEPPPGIVLGSPETWPEIGGRLRGRVELLLEIVDNDEYWQAIEADDESTD